MYDVTMKLQALEVAENISAAKPFRVDLRSCEFITQLTYSAQHEESRKCSFSVLGHFLSHCTC